MKLNVSLHLLSSGKPKAILLLLALWAKIEQQGREMDYVFWDKLVKMSQGSSVCDAMVNPVGQSLWEDSEWYGWQQRPTGIFVVQLKKKEVRG